MATAAAAFVRFGPAEEEHAGTKDTGGHGRPEAAATMDARGAAGAAGAPGAPGAPGERPGVVRSGRLALHSETWLVECD